MMERAEFTAEIGELCHMQQWMRLHLGKRGVEKATIRRLELVLEEAVVNIIHHGYREAKGKIEIALRLSPEVLEIVVRDWAPPFDPLANAPSVDPNAPLEERQTGGLGIYLMQQILDEMTYERDGCVNVLTLVKRTKS